MTDTDAQPASPYPHSGAPQPVKASFLPTAIEVPDDEECELGRRGVVEARKILDATKNAKGNA